MNIDRDITSRKTKGVSLLFNFEKNICMKFNTLLLVFFIVLLGCRTKDLSSTNAKETTESISDNTTETKTPNANTNEEVLEERDEATDNTSLDDKGYGPITSIILGEIDVALVKEGKQIFDNNCKACHHINKKWIGPAMKGVTKRRSPEWIMNMILNPIEMTEVNPVAIQLLKEYTAPMPNQYLNIDQVRAILEYFREVDNE